MRAGAGGAHSEPLGGALVKQLHETQRHSVRGRHVQQITIDRTDRAAPTIRDHRMRGAPGAASERLPVHVWSRKVAA